MDRRVAVRRALRRVLGLAILLVVVAPGVAGATAPGSGPARSTVPTQAPADGTTLIQAAFGGLLGRSAGAGELAYWQSELDRGVAPRSVVARIGNSTEQRRFLVRKAYETILDRAPDSAGLDYWSGAIITRFSARELHASFFASPELYERAGGTPAGFVDRLYRVILSRPAEPAGSDYWVGRLAAGTLRSQVAKQILASPEAILQPDLSVTASTPRAGSTATSLDRVRVELDRSIVAGTSVLLVSVDGTSIPGATTDGAGGRSLEFTPTNRWWSTVTVAKVVVTVFAFDGTTVEHTDLSFRLRPAPAAGDELMVAFYGHPRTAALGILGETSPAVALQRLRNQAAPYAASGRPVMPVFELIATLVTASPGADGLYRQRESNATIRPYLDTIRSAGGRLILDIQPGRARFIDEARAYETMLREPEVGLALDPEWAVGPTGVPGGGAIGTVDAAAINEVSAYMSQLVTSRGLPPKVLMIHRFTPGMVTNTDAIVSRPGVIILFHADGEGSAAAKYDDYHNLLPARFRKGIKIFYDEDPRVIPPAELLALRPQPDFVSYQ